jgi:hypothetical protein
MSYIVSPIKMQKTKALLAVKYIGATPRSSVPTAFLTSIDQFEKDAET